MAKIHILDEHLSNMIAAGEVVERPANIVKECVENSIDAHAKTITIEVWEGGIEKIVITDDGEGMSREDASLSFIRHATSKIKDEDDLFSIHTMGFRGEALPSIAAVSHVEMQTNNGKESTEIIYDYGQEIKNEPAGCPGGTKITVTGLFFKTPARFKYLRKASSEFSVIADLINKMALSYPDIRFSLSHNDRLVFQTSGQGNILEIIYQIYGREVAQAAEPFDQQTLDFHIHGYAVQPRISRASKYFIFISVNHRLIRSVPVQNTIIDAYHEFMPPNRYPIFLIDIEVDPQLVDVNVHPNKWEIRLTKQKELTDLIKETIDSLFAQKLRTVEVDPKRVDIQKVPVEQKEETIVQPVLDLEGTQTVAALKKEVKEIPEYENVYDNQDEIYEQSYENHRSQFMKMMEEERPSEQEYKKEAYEEPEPENREKGKEDLAQEVERIRNEKKEQSLHHETGHDFFAHLKVIGQLKDSYILCENEKGLVIIDQHAAQERYHYEQIRDEFKKPVTKTQPLMLPLQVHVSVPILSHIQEINEKTSQFGIVFEPFGKERVIVREVPIWMKDVEEQDFLEDLISLFMQDLHVDIAKIQKHMLATMACHSSIRFNRKLTFQEMEQVIKDLQKCGQPYHCPHGRPTVITLSDSDLRKEFERG